MFSLPLVSTGFHLYHPSKDEVLTHSALLKMNEVEVQHPSWPCRHLPSESRTLTHTASLSPSGGVSSVPCWAPLTSGEGKMRREVPTEISHCPIPSCWNWVGAYHWALLILPHLGNLNFPWFHQAGDRILAACLVLLTLSQQETWITATCFFWVRHGR